MSAVNKQPAPRRKRSPWQVQRAVLFALLLREMKARMDGHLVGAVWTVFEPMGHLLILLAVHRMLRSTPVGSMEFTVFLITGLIPFFFFQKLVFRLLDGVDANRGLYTYRQVKPIDALIARVAVEAMLYGVVYGVTLLILGWVGLEVIPDSPLQVLAVNMLTAAFGASFGLLLAVLGHDRPRLRSMIRMLFLPLYFTSGVIVRLDHLPPRAVYWIQWNPLVHVVELSRRGFSSAYRLQPDITFTYPLAWTLLSAALGLVLYRVNRLRLQTII